MSRFAITLLAVATMLALGCYEPPATDGPAAVDIVYHPDGRVEVDRQSINELTDGRSGPVRVRLIRSGEVVLEHTAATLREARAFLQQQEPEVRKEFVARQPDASPELRAIGELLASIPPEPVRSLLTANDLTRLVGALEAAEELHRNYASLTPDERVEAISAIKDSVNAVMERAK